MASLKEYYKKGIYFGIVKDVYQEGNKISALVVFNETIGGIDSLHAESNCAPYT